MIRILLFKLPEKWWRARICQAATCVCIRHEYFFLRIQDLGCFGHVSLLRRIEVDPFTEEDFVTIAQLEAVRPARQSGVKRSVALRAA